MKVLLLGVAIMTAVLAALGALPARAQTNFPQVMPPSTVYGRSAIGAGPGQAIPFSVIIQTMNNQGNIWTATQTFSPPSPGPAITTNQTLSGTISVGAEVCVSICANITSDTASTPVGLNAFQVNHNFGGPTVSGTRNGFLAILTQTAPGNPSNPFPTYTGMAGLLLVNDGAGDALGTYFGENPQVRLNGGTVRGLTGSESDIFGTATANQEYAFAYSAVGEFVNSASVFDAAYEIHMGAFPPYGAACNPPSPPCGPGWKFGLVAAELSNGYPPIAPTGTFIGTYLGSLMTIPIAYGIDLRGFTASQQQIIGSNFNITPAGGIFGSALVSNGGSAALGANTTAPGALSIASAAGGGAYVAVKNPSATVAYNFNLPATAGAAGDVLASGGGVAAPMTWITGVTQTCTVNTASALTLIFTNGVLTGGTCNI